MSLHHCHPELVSGSQKLRRFRNMSWIIGRSAGSTQPSLGRVSLSLHSYQNPQFGMTINNIPLLEITDFGPPARGGHFVLFHFFLLPQPYGTQFHTAHIMDCKQKKDKVLTLSFFIYARRDSNSRPFGS